MLATLNIIDLLLNFFPKFNYVNFFKYTEKVNQFYSEQYAHHLDSTLMFILFALLYSHLPILLYPPIHLISTSISVSCFSTLPHPPQIL